MGKITKISPELKILLEKQHYCFSGEHSAVKICTWTKKSLIDEGICYKEKFYGIRCHLCCQISPSVGFCTSQCIHCWREMNYTVGIEMNDAVDEPKEIIKKSIECQKKLLNGYPGNTKTNMEKFEEAQEPMHFAISLTGEPTIYPRLGELISELHKLGKTTFLVTNGQFPKVIENLKELPTQLYISLSSTNKKDFEKFNKSCFKDGWQRLNKSLEIMSRLNTRTTIRITAMKKINMKDEKGFTELIKKASPMFVEVKAYMFVGSSRRRLLERNMPFHEDVKEFAEKVAELSGYKVIDEKKES
ncbi:MAG: 4-demethylwyosine synthase TYW1, partial [Nanoarchaeota archaeon]|nr:4-demethylwyosine synthase TYW1 [Nanoarchaeota archaeon]